MWSRSQCACSAGARYPGRSLYLPSRRGSTPVRRPRQTARCRADGLPRPPTASDEPPRWSCRRSLRWRRSGRQSGRLGLGRTPTGRSAAEHLGCSSFLLYHSKHSASQPEAQEAVGQQGHAPLQMWLREGSAPQLWSDALGCLIVFPL